MDGNISESVTYRSNRNNVDDSFATGESSPSSAPASLWVTEGAKKVRFDSEKSVVIVDIFMKSQGNNANGSLKSSGDKASISKKIHGSSKGPAVNSLADPIQKYNNMNSSANSSLGSAAVKVFDPASRSNF